MSQLPPGIKPNYVDPPDHKKQTIILQSIVLTLVTAFTGIRIYTRAFITRKLGADDCKKSATLLCPDLTNNE
jgi:hypothetical protein